jgi:hypothetical protein
VLNPLPHEHIVKNGRFHWKASCYKFKLLRNYEKCFNTDETWHKCWLAIASETACSILNFLLPWHGGDVSKLPNLTILHCFISIKTDFKVLQLLNELRQSKRLFSVGYTSPFWQLPDLPFWGGGRKSDHFFNNISQTKKGVSGLISVVLHCLRPQKKGGRVKKPLKHVYMR